MPDCSAVHSAIIVTQMIVYRLQPDAEAYEWLTFPRDEDFNISQTLRGTSVLGQWNPARVFH